MPETRELDLVLFGATGFTGALTADYLARTAPTGCAGRWPGATSPSSRTCAPGSAGHRPGLADLPLLHADVDDADSLAESPRARVVITTVGPYLGHGEPLVAACAEAGTDYVDLTGEPEFVDRMYVAHHATAVAHRCAARARLRLRLDPARPGRLFTVSSCRRRPITVRGVVRAGGVFSGGTFHSALTAMSRPPGHAARPPGRAGASSRAPRAGRRGRSPASRTGTRCSASGCAAADHRPAIVARSGAALAAYGPDFRYSHYAGMKTLPYAVGGAVGRGRRSAWSRRSSRCASLADEAGCQPGDGPDEARRAKSWFRVDFVGEGGGETVHTRVSGGDPGYDETAKMLAESALCLAFDDKPATAGQVTTAQAMGANLLARVQAGGLTFEVL